MNNPFIHSPLTSKKMYQYFLFSIFIVLYYSLIVRGNIIFYLSVLVLGLFTCYFLIKTYIHYTNENWDELKVYINPLQTMLFFTLLYPVNLPFFGICLMVGIYILFSLLAYKYRLDKWSSFFLTLSLSYFLFSKLGINLNSLLISSNKSFFETMSFYILPCLIGFGFLLFTKSTKWKISIIPIFTLLIISIITFLFHSGSILGRFYNYMASPILFYLCFLANHFKDTPVSGVGCLIYGMILGMALFIFNAHHSILRLSYIFVFLPLITPLLDYIGSSNKPAIQKAIIPIFCFLIIVIAFVK